LIITELKEKKRRRKKGDRFIEPMGRKSMPLCPIS